MQRHGLLPSSQKALTVRGWIDYHDFEGTATEAGEQPRIVRDLGDRRFLVLRNHGLLSVGETMGEAFVWIYRLETACRHQIDALSGGSELQSVSPETQERATSGRGFGCTALEVSSKPARSGPPCCASSTAPG